MPRGCSVVTGSGEKFVSHLPQGGVAQVDDAASRAAFVDELKLAVHLVGEAPRATPDNYRCEEVLPLIHQTGSDRVPGEFRPSWVQRR